MEFVEFAATAAAIDEEPADLEIQSLVADALRDSGTDLATLVRFLLGRVFPAHNSRTLDIGPRLCYEAIARAAGQNISADDVETRLAETGEIGAVAASYDFGGQQGLAAFGNGGQEALTVAAVETRLRELAAVDGAGSQETKLDILFGLFNRCTDDEARYLARLVLEEMRIGVGGGSVRGAIAEAFDVPVDSVERALQLSNDYGLVAETARAEGEDGLEAIQLEVGRPVQAMLAQTGTVRGALEDWENVGVEVKYDGARVQVHYDGERVALYSRNMEDVTEPLPEIVATVEQRIDVPVILDGEVVAVDDAGDPLPFQQILRRFRRKHDVAKAQENVSLRLHAFDCLHADGEDLLGAPLVERHDRLAGVFDGEDSNEVSRLWLCEDAETIEEIESDALADGHEGIMLKQPDAAYTPGKRGQNWRKRKPDVETLDLVVTGAEWGEGRRASVLGTFELSVRAGEEYETIGKVATGITDEKLQEVTDLLEPHITAESGTEVDIDPAVVFEVGYEEIQSSPTYSSGYALRFPRFLSIRTDKAPAEADSLARVERLVETGGD
jgi:DNA ligase-1